MGNNCGCGCGQESNETIINPADLRLAKRNRANLARVTMEGSGEGEQEEVEGDTMLFRKKISRQYSRMDQN